MNFDYILDGKTPQPEPDSIAHALWMKQNKADKRRVGSTRWEYDGIKYWLVTTFMGYDRNFEDIPDSPSYKPLTFETALFQDIRPNTPYGLAGIFNPGHEELSLSNDVDVEGTSTWDEAERCHDKWRKRLEGKSVIHDAG